MTDLTRPGDGDSEIAAPLDHGPAAADAHPQGFDDEPETDAVRTHSGARLSNGMILLGAILVIVVAQLVVSMLALVSTNQVRDQYTSANALQRCLIHAQLNVNQTTDPSGTGYKAAVNNCLK